MSSKNNFLMILNAVFLAFLLVLVSYSYGKTQNESNLNTITLTQTVEKKVMPDLAIVEFSIVTKAKDMNTTIEKNKALNMKLLDALKSYKVETTNFYVDEDRVWNSTTRNYEVMGYIARNSIKVSCAPEELAKVVETGLKNGANRVNNINWDLKDETKSKIKKELITDAIKKAIEKANIIANASNKKVIGIVKIQPYDWNVYPIYKAFNIASGEYAERDFEFKPEEQKVRYSVNIVFKIN